MTRRIVRIALLALVVGVAAGALAGALVDASPSRSGAAPPPPRLAPARPTPEFVAPMELMPGTLRVERRAADPDGGPQWVLRSYRARLIPTQLTRRRRAGSPFPCIQLGRVVGGRFGWIDGSNTFRPVESDAMYGSPTQCGIGNDRPPPIDVQTLIAGLNTARPRLTHTVLWGTVGPTASSLVLRVPGQRLQPELSPSGAFVTFADPSVGTRTVRATVTRGGGPPRPLPLGPRIPRVPSLPGRPLDRVKPLPHAPISIEARAPDPNGGLAWGLGAVRATDGRWCETRNGRIVGNRVGSVNFQLGTLTDPIIFPENDCPQPGNRLRGRRLVTTGTETTDGAYSLPESDPATGRTARRTLPGFTAFPGHARADVREVTISTPRGVRTLVPSRRTHSYLAVFDGEFPTGDITVTGRTADGTTFTERFSNAGL